MEVPVSELGISFWENLLVLYASWGKMIAVLVTALCYQGGGNYSQRVDLAQKR